MFSTISYNWKGIGNVVGKGEFFTSECFIEYAIKSKSIIVDWKDKT